MKKLFIALLINLCVLPAIAQNADYAEMAKEIDLEVWGDKDPIFSNNKLPEEFKNESAVILARKQIVETNTERKGRSLLYVGKMHSTIKKIIRERIFINDKSSLELYSEINFNQLQSKQSGPITKLRKYTFMGIRVTKPDGTVQKIDVDEASVKIDETQAGKKNKIAVPNLAIGDVLDYYITYFDQARTDKDVDFLTFVLGDEYPILNLGIKVLLDKRIAAQYQVINGAPDFKIIDVDGDNLMELKASNLSKSTNVMWTSETRQVPIVRIKYAFADIVHGRGDYTKAGTIEKVTNPTDVEHQFVNLIKPFLAQLPTAGDVKRAWKAYARERAIDSEDMDSIISYVYYYYRAEKYGKLIDYSDINMDLERFVDCHRTMNKIKQLELVLTVMKTLNAVFDMEAELVLVSASNEVSYKDIFSIADFNYLLRVPKQGSKYAFFYFGSNLYNFNEIPAVFEGETYRYIQQRSITKKGRDMSQDEADEVNGNAVSFRTTLDDNRQIEELIIEMDSANMQLLNIKRRSTALGHFRRDLQNSTLILEDYLKAEANVLGKTKDPMERQTGMTGKVFDKLWIDIYQFIPKAKKDQKEKFESEIRSDYQDKPKELKNYEILQTGFKGTNAAMKIEEDFSMDGWVKKAGNNYIIEAGKFVGGQLEISAEQRERKLDIYMPFARSFTHRILFKIPDGYTVEGIDKLNKSIKNECGGFECTAKIEGSKLLITYNKYYNNAKEPAANWGKLLAFIDPGFAFTKEKILLKKK